MIIKNCPCFVEGIAIKGLEQKTNTCNNYRIKELTYCEDINDCILKKIINLCAPVKKEWECNELNALIEGKFNIAGKILLMLEIEDKNE